MDLDHEDRRGQEAERLMSEPLVKEAFAKMETALIESLKRVDLKDTDTQKTIVANIQVLHSFRKLLQTTIETGKMARIQKQTLAQSILKKVKG
jgi:hypothetical protein